MYYFAIYFKLVYQSGERKPGLAGHSWKWFEPWPVLARQKKHKIDRPYTFAADCVDLEPDVLLPACLARKLIGLAKASGF